MNGGKQNWGTLALAAAAVYVVYKIFSGIGTVAGAVTNVGQAIGSGLFDFFNPDPGGVQTLFNVTFPDGSRHAIASNIIGSGGGFTVPAYITAYAGRELQIVTDKNGNHAAFPP